MAVESVSAGGDFRIGRIFYRALEIFLANFVFFAIVAFVVSLPDLLSLLEPPSDESSFLPPSFLIAILLGMFLNTIGLAIILFGAFQYLRGQPVVPAEAIQRCLARLPAIAGYAILSSLAFLVGLVLLIVPAIILAVIWAAGLPACAVEGLAPLDSFRRSSQLTKGYRWKIFWITILLLIGIVIGSWITDLILAQAGIAAKAFGALIWAAVSAAYADCVYVMVYHDLRVAKEGIDAAQTAATFD